MTKKLSVAFAALAVILTIVAPLSAQSFSLTAKIPFEFSASGKTLPAGDYSVVMSTGLQSIVQVRNVAMSTGVLALTGSLGGGDRSRAGEPRLVFNDYGSHYVLSQVWDGYSATGREFTKSRSERELAKTASAKRIEILAMLMPR